tara:strand:- start:384 stop:641 length:258 start_codon:yes stop_codon:yes gene_type:complete
MRSRRFKGSDFEEMISLDFDNDSLIRERVMGNDYKTIYTLKDVSKWIEYGIRNGLVIKSTKKEDIESMMKWVDLLGKEGKNISLR